MFIKSVLPTFRNMAHLRVESRDSRVIGVIRFVSTVKNTLKSSTCLKHLQKPCFLEATDLIQEVLVNITYLHEFVSIQPVLVG